MIDDGYQGPNAHGPSTLTPEQEEIVGLSDQITRLEDQAQDAEDRERLGRASEIRARIRPLKVRLDALVAARPEAPPPK